MYVSWFSLDMDDKGKEKNKDIPAGDVGLRKLKANGFENVVLLCQSFRRKLCLLAA